MSDRASVRGVLVVDDSPNWASVIARRLTEDGHSVSIAHDGLSALEIIRDSPPRILITDYFLANVDGGKLCQVAKHVDVKPAIATIILTGGADRKLSRAPSPYADAVIAKNTPDIVVEDLRAVLSKLRVRLPPPREEREIVGHERLHPRALSTKLYGIKQHLEALQQSVGDAVIGIDQQRRVYTINERALEMLTVREADALACPIHEVLDVPEDHSVIAAVRRAVEHGVDSDRPLELLAGDAKLRVRVRGILGADHTGQALLVATDLSELTAAEHDRAALTARLNQADKMAAVGQLISGISHEINNPLAALIPNLQSLQEYFQEITTALRSRAETGAEPRGSRLDFVLADIPELLEDCQRASERIRVVVADLRLFGSNKEAPAQQVRVERLLESALTLAASEIRHRARVEREYAQVPPLMADEARLGQAVLNIIVNAVQAIEGDERAGVDHWLRVTTASDGGGVLIEISNSGPTITEEHLPRVFEPFFTTRALGEGVGLGLSIAYETVRRHGGYLEVSSDQHTPTTFRMWLPVDTGLVLQAGSREPMASSEKSCRILIVDDERAVRNSLRRGLERDHRVELAPSGADAMERLRGGARFDAILCDLIMPEMTGMELFGRVQDEYPEQAQRFVFLTGGTSNAAARQFLRGVDRPRAYKPIEREELTELVAQCLTQFEAEGG